MEVLKNIGKFLLGAVIKVFVIVVGVLLIWLVLCILMEDGFKEGFIRWAGSRITHFVAGWVIGAGISVYEGIKEGSILKVVVGIVIFFAPVILLAVSTPDPDIELYDSSGNLWKLRKG